MDLYELFDDAIDNIAAWHYSEGWGNLFTVTVASIAIVASVVVSRITLRRNAAQFKQGQLDKRNEFEQGRVDKRNDKLREEVIDLISALSERSSQGEIVNQRIRKLERTDLPTMHQNIKAIFFRNPLGFLPASNRARIRGSDAYRGRGSHRSDRAHT